MTVLFKLLKSCVFLCVFLLTLKVEGQELEYSHQILGVEDGLASREVLCGLQDQKGFLWFGTRNGLNRYDGKRFTLLTPRDALQGSRIVNLAEDKGGNIWISYGKVEGSFDADGRIDIYKPASGELIPFEKMFTELPFNQKDITNILHDKDFNIYLLVDPLMVYKYLPSKGFELWINATETFGNILRSSVFTPHQKGGNIALNDQYLYYGKLLKFNDAPNRSISYFNDQGILEYVSAAVNRPLHLRVEKHFLNGEIKTEEILVDALTYSIIRNLDIIEGRWNDKFGSAVLLPLYRGVYLFKDYKCIPLLEGSNHGKDFSLNLSFFSDWQGNYWVNSPQGLHKFTPKPKRFQVLFDEGAIDMKDPMGNQVRAICDDGGSKIWTGGHFGLIFYDKKDGKYYPKLRTDDDIWVHCLHKNNGKIYFFGSGCHYVDLSGNKISKNFLLDLNLTPKEYLANIGFIWAAFPLPGQRYLLGNDHGKLMIWDIKKNTISYIESCDQVVPFSNFIYRIIFSTKDQHYWAVGGAGVYRVSKDLCVTDYYNAVNSKDDKHRLPFSDFRDIHEDKDGTFWLATNGKGLLRWDYRNNDFQFFTIQDGMPSNILYRIESDEYGNLWVSTDNGLVRFHKSTHNINVYSTVDGIAHNEFNRISSFKGSDGHLYFGGIDGLTAFHPRNFGIDTSAVQIPLRITDYYQFLASNSQLTNLTHQLLTEKKIILRPGDKFFRLEFALLDFQSSGRNYKYKIDGFDKDWLFIKEPQLQISGLPYGSYQLRVAGQGYSGTWSELELSIPILVLRPWYLTWWAVTMFGLALVFSLWRIRAYQIRRLLEKEDKKRLQEIDALKNKLYTNITHEFRTPLTVIMGMAKQLEEESGEWVPEGTTKLVESQTRITKKIRERTNLILRNAKSLLSLINQMLDLSKLDSGKLEINLEPGDVVLFMQYLSESFHSFAETKKIQLTFYPEVESLVMDFDAEKLQHIISNLLSNAVKFTPEKGKVVFHISEIPANGDNPEDFLQIKVSNSGAGIPSEFLPHIFDRFYQADPSGFPGNTGTSEGSGIGLALTKDLVELLGGSISVESSIGKGVMFTIRLPVKKSASLGPVVVPPLEDVALFGITQMADQNFDLPINEDAPILLLIEDNADVATYIRDCMANEYTVLWAANGQLGIEKALETVPDIIISDVMMPEKDGYEVTRFLKNDERTSHIPIVLLTAKAGMDSRITGLEQGADAYLVKPFDKKELQVSVKKLIELRQKLQEYYGSKQSLNVETITTDISIQTEETFLQKVNGIIEIHLAEADYGVPQLSRELQMSHSQLYRKIKALTGISIAAYLTSHRIHRGKILLQTTDLNVSEVAYEVGFTDPAYFSRVFSETFGFPPTESRK